MGFDFLNQIFLNSLNIFCIKFSQFQFLGILTPSVAELLPDKIYLSPNFSAGIIKRSIALSLVTQYQPHWPYKRKLQIYSPPSHT